MRRARTLALDFRERISAELTEEERDELERRVKLFQGAGGRADITAWVGDVERCASRAGYLLSGDLDVAAAVLRDEPGGVVSVEDQMADLLGTMDGVANRFLKDPESSRSALAFVAGLPLGSAKKGRP